MNLVKRHSRKSILNSRMSIKKNKRMMRRLQMKWTNQWSRKKL